MFPTNKSQISSTIEQIYKADSRKLLAVLTRIFGPQNFDLAENVLQETFTKALINWQQQGAPENPSGWLISSAKNLAIDLIRQKKTQVTFADDLAFYLESEWSLGVVVEQAFSQPKIKDDQLRMIFACCDLDLKPQNQIPFILKTLCGFSLEAVARALLQPVEVIKKRLQRTRKQLQQQAFDFPEPAQLNDVLDKVHTVLYLLFNEGFHSSDRQQAINLMFCREAIGLTKLLIEELETGNQDTYALLALMQFHMARVASRLDSQGQNIPLDLQNRRLWDSQLLSAGRFHLSTAAQFTASTLIREDLTKSAVGRFYYEALIMQEHCKAASFDQTNWLLIANIYQRLIELTQSPVAILNQAVAVAYAGDVEVAIGRVEQLLTDKLLAKSYQSLAVLAHLCAKAGDIEQALQHAKACMQMGGTAHEHQLLLQQIERLRAC